MERYLTGPLIPWIWSEPTSTVFWESWGEFAARGIVVVVLCEEVVLWEGRMSLSKGCFDIVEVTDVVWGSLKNAV